MKYKFFFFTPYAWLAPYCREHAIYCQMNTFHATNRSDQLNLYSELSDSVSETQLLLHWPSLSMCCVTIQLWICLEALAQNTGTSKPSTSRSLWGISIRPVPRSRTSQNSSFPPHGFTLMGLLHFFLKKAHVALLRKAERLQKPSNWNSGW